MSRPLAASVRGWAALWVFNNMEPKLRDAREHFEREGRPDLARHVTLTIEDLGEAAAQYVAWRDTQGSGDGTAEPDSAEPGAGSPVMDEITTSAASDLLGVSTRRVTRLLNDGVIDGRLVGRVWLVDRSSVLRYRDARRAA